MTTNSSTTWTRLAVPTGPAAGVTSGTYFRLGAYNSTEESAIMPPSTYKYYSSTLTSAYDDTPPELSMDGAAEYNDPDYGLADTDPRKRPNYDQSTYTTTREVPQYGPNGEYLGTTTVTDTHQRGEGSLTENMEGGNTVRNTTRNFEQLVISVAKAPQTPLNYGILAKTDGDVITNVGGGGILRFTKGIAFGSATGDVNIDAAQGTIGLTCKNGVSITAGNPQSRANISLTAFGYIKQTAYGPLDDVRFSTSSFKTYGWAKEWFYGEKFFEIHGKNTSNLYGIDQKATFAEQRYVTFAGRISFAFGISLDMVMSVDLKINVGVNVGITIAARFDIAYSFVLRMNYGTDVKVVSVMDVKIVPVDVKICDVDFKVATISVNKPTLEAAMADLKTQRTTAHANSTSIKAAQDSLEARLGMLRLLS